MVPNLVQGLEAVISVTLLEYDTIMLVMHAKYILPTGRQLCQQQLLMRYTTPRTGGAVLPTLRAPLFSLL